jgi:hypothetical protein
LKLFREEAERGTAVCEMDDERVGSEEWKEACNVDSSAERDESSEESIV